MIYISDNARTFGIKYGVEEMQNDSSACSLVHLVSCLFSVFVHRWGHTASYICSLSLSTAWGHTASYNCSLFVHWGHTASYICSLSLSTDWGHTASYNCSLFVHWGHTASYICSLSLSTDWGHTASYIWSSSDNRRSAVSTTESMTITALASLGGFSHDATTHRTHSDHGAHVL